MKCTNLLIALSILLAVAVYFIYQRSPFIGDILNNNYGTLGCSHNNRQQPEGNVPGSWLGLNKSEQQQLLTKFVNDNQFKK
jgi:hypothetical protein